LIFIVFLIRKKHNQDRALADWRGLEGLCFASASLFPVLALNKPVVASGSHLVAPKSIKFCFYSTDNTKSIANFPAGLRLLSSRQKSEGT
jgi:hypothetical protein